MKRTSVAHLRAGTAMAGLLGGLVLLPNGVVLAQTAPRAEGSTSLPAVEVNPPQSRANRANPPSRTQRAAGPRQGVTAPARNTAQATPTPNNTAGTRERALGPVDGYVAKRSTTGSKTDTAILENPQSISVVGREQLEQQGSTTVAESLRYTAGVLAGSRPGNRFDDIFIRGFGGFGFTAGYIQFLDGLKMQRGISYAVPNIDPYGLDRIEVIKGPASVLYGQTNPGGLVNMVSRRPKEKAFGEVELQVGNYNVCRPRSTSAASSTRTASCSTASQASD